MPRYRTRLPVHWTLQGEELAQPAITRDVGPGGFCIESTARPVSGDIQLRFLLASNEVLHVIGKVVWMRCLANSESGLVYWIGVRIVHAPEQWYRACRGMGQSDDVEPSQLATAKYVA